jgi:hypothetical protein
LNVNGDNLNDHPCILVENIDGVSGLKYFVPSNPLVKDPNMCFDINMQPDTNGVFTVNEQVETDISMSVETVTENAD